MQIAKRLETKLMRGFSSCGGNDGKKWHITVRGFALRGFGDSNVSHKTKISKQLDDFLKH
jgi:hypothetical protein